MTSNNEEYVLVPEGKILQLCGNLSEPYFPINLDNMLSYNKDIYIIFIADEKIIKISPEVLIKLLSKYNIQDDIND